MRALLLLSASVALALTACKPALKDDAKVGAEACVAGLAPAPDKFSANVAQAQGAVKTRSCTTLAFGRTSAGEIVIAKYDADGRLDTTFAENGAYRPFVGQLREYRVQLQRLAVLADGYLALGTVARDDGASDLWMFQLAENGYLNFNFGPRHEGYVMGAFSAGQVLRQVDAPIVTENRLNVPLTYELAMSGTQFTRVVSLTVNGREAWPVARFAIPGRCDSIAHTSYVNGTYVELKQSACDSVTLTVQGPTVRETVFLLTNGTPAASAWYGDLSLHYENGQPIMISRDGFGNIRNEYLSFAQGREYLCGQKVKLDQRYLVFSLRPVSAPDHYTSCHLL